MNTYYTETEMQAYTIARLIKEDQIIIVGTGLPLVGATLAKKLFVPSCSLIVESGLMDCNPIEIPRSVSDLRFMEHCCVQWQPIRYIGFQANEWLHHSDRLIAFIGGAQIDPYGNVGSTSIGDYYKPKLRLPGSGGANGIATYANTIIMMQHQKRRFMEKIDYITSPGWIDGPDGRKRRNLPTDRGPQMVVTERGIFKFHETTKRMYLHAYYPSSSIQEIVDNTGFEIDVADAVRLEEPDPEIIRILREEIDPERIYLDL